MSMYSLSCSCYSFLLDKMVARFRAKPVYVGGQLVYSVGMVCLALTKTKWAVLIFSWTAGRILNFINNSIMFAFNQV